MEMIKLRAGNDRNGNPRRVYVALGGDSGIIGIWDIGYSGSRAVPKRYQRKAIMAPTFDITTAEYNYLFTQKR